MSILESELSENAQKLFMLRYSLKDHDGHPTEGWMDAVKRVAINVASVEALYNQGEREDFDDAYIEDFPMRTAYRQWRWLYDGETDFYDALAAGWQYALNKAEEFEYLIGGRFFLPNSPTWTGAGTPLGQLSACFVLPVHDDLGRYGGSIFGTLRDAALIQQTGGGNGFDFSELRPKGARIKTSKGEASGPVGFLKTYDSAFGEIAQGGTRRGANMGILRVDHPDVMEFIEAKTTEGEIANFNISVALTDEFMDKITGEGGPARTSDDFDLVYDGEVYDTVSAKALFDKLTSDAWKLGDPGCLFVDKANQDNPVPGRYTLAATNPCGEQWLGEYENCCLGSIAVNRLVTGSIGSGQMDWGRLKGIIRSSVDFLDNVIDANQYVPDVPKLEEAAQGGRRIGLGIMGLADALIRMGIPYGSPEAQRFSAELMRFVRYEAMVRSMERAIDRGPFEWYDDSIFAGGSDGWMPPTWPEWLGPEPDAEEWERKWSALADDIIAHGIRNSCVTTIAPTGTISNIADLEGSGCEPLFALSYVRTVMQEGENLYLDYLSPLFHEALEGAGLDMGTIESVLTKVKSSSGSCQGIHEVPGAIQDIFRVAADVTPEEHVRMQAALQAYVDNSISKTINMPNEATVEDVAEVYKMAYRLGCKGITIYRQGSRELEVLSAAKKDKNEPVIEDEVVDVIPRQIPSDAFEQGLAARVFPLVINTGRKMQVTITELPDEPGRPFDVRLQVGKAGNDLNAHTEALGRMVSLSLRAGVPVKYVVEQLHGIGGQTVHGFGPNKVRSVADGLAKLLARLYVEDTQVSATITPLPDPEEVDTTDEVTLGADGELLCPQCGNATIVLQEGCFHCEARLGGCGDWSGCS